MAKVFTITHGLENMGAMKTGGQGSVYKGRRAGEIITAIKLLPTPIFSESESDKNFRDFKNEVEKLKKVNKDPNPNVVKIISSGLSETGNFPFIEMEFIEGPDLEDLLQPPHDPLFSIKEAIRVAEHLSNALAHCHKCDVKHGDIKSNNVKYNLNTGNYVLLDFGLAVMSDEQRRTSLRKAGAVEFMAPEQNEGETLFETDIYSFGVIIFELLAGQVPFPLHDKGESARNNVRLAHMETLPPDLIALRKGAMPATWPQDKRNREMQVPEWLVTMIYKCLKKKPESRFRNGIELHDYIVYNSTHLQPELPAKPGYPAITNDREKEQLQLQVSQYRQQINQLQKEVEQLKTSPINRISLSDTTSTYPSAASTTVQREGVSKTAFFILLVLTVGFAVFAAYFYMNGGSRSQALATEHSTSFDSSAMQQNTQAAELALKREEQIAKQKRIDSFHAVQRAKAEALKKYNDSVTSSAQTTTDNNNNNQTATQPNPSSAKGTQYMVIAKAYFYNSPDESTRRNAFVVPSNNAIVTGLDEEGDFVYVQFVNTQGQSSKGWLRKQDLQQLNE